MLQIIRQRGDDLVGLAMLSGGVLIVISRPTMESLTIAHELIAAGLLAMRLNPHQE